MNSNEVISWFDELESVLAAGAKLRGLLEHASTVGLAREFVVTEVLRSILPEAVHIGTGRVVDQFGNSSKQIDIVIYDPRFPKLTVAGGALYMAEGVLATIEIKSCIDADQLRGALDNCASVLALGVKGQFPEQAKARIDFYQSVHGLEHPQAVDMFHYMVRPATYIFLSNRS